jgi:hypothetical protein
MALNRRRPRLKKLLCRLRNLRPRLKKLLCRLRNPRLRLNQSLRRLRNPRLRLNQSLRRLRNPRLRPNKPLRRLRNPRPRPKKRPRRSKNEPLNRLPPHRPKKRGPKGTREKGQARAHSQRRLRPNKARRPKPARESRLPRRALPRGPSRPKSRRCRSRASRLTCRGRSGSSCAAPGRWSVACPDPLRRSRQAGWARRALYHSRWPSLLLPAPHRPCSPISSTAAGNAVIRVSRITHRRPCQASRQADRAAPRRRAAVRVRPARAPRHFRVFICMQRPHGCDGCTSRSRCGARRPLF